jgi:ubiquinone biosynthesis UbiH/UbiF/VisC/COQ6 family hydroxylase
MDGRESAGSDVLIIGAGLPGLTLALALRGTGLSVRLIDRHRPAIDMSAEWDARIYAISPGNAQFLHGLGIWSRLDADRIEAMDSMRVLGDRAGTQLDFSAFDVGERALAWMVEQRELMAATLAEWSAHEKPEAIESGSQPAALARERDRLTVRLENGDTLSARLVVGADGLRSWVREQSGISTSRRSYEQSAIVANFEVERAHHGRAWQWFQPDGGVLAWLPLPQHRMSIVWSVPQSKADHLLALDEATFTSEVFAAGSGVLGALRLITARASFPLSYLRPTTAIGERVVLIGDAAHGIHPLAGQGLNLGYGDVAALGRVLRERGPIADVGAPLLLSRFERARAWSNLSMQAVTDGLWRMFSTDNRLISSVRNRGMTILNGFPGIKALLMQPAMR